MASKLSTISESLYIDCPVRALLLTGLYPTQNGMGYMVGNRWIASYQGYPNGNGMTVAEALRAAGYSPGISGKWHADGLYAANSSTKGLAQSMELTPANHGFERSSGVLGGATSYWN